MREGETNYEEPPFIYLSHVGLPAQISANQAYSLSNLAPNHITGMSKAAQNFLPKSGL